ncbi:MAG: hypothetical protein ABGZ23_17650 [Fuerstiella sp.]|nr:hypothetical protein [Fuerstiella sp.]
MKSFSRLLLSAGLFVGTTGSLLIAADELRRNVAVGLRRQLFVDDYVVARKENVVRELGEVTKANGGRPILVADKPWETDHLLIGSVFRDGDRFRMFYKAGYAPPAVGDPPGTPHLLIATAESVDGLRWTKPELGIRIFNGSAKNNLIGRMGMTCFLDPHETDPEHKYKAAYSHWQKMSAALAYSPDGLHWTPYNNTQPVTYRAADTINQLLWDEDAAVYRLYTREDYQSKLRAKIEVRGTRDMTNADVKAHSADWTTTRRWLLDREGPEDYKRRQIYSLNGWMYEGIQFGLLWSLDWPTDLSEGPRDLVTRHERDVMNCYIATTRGEQDWNLHWIYTDQPLIPRGPAGSFDKDWVQPAINIVTWNDKHWIYYGGARERHGMEGRGPISIGLATLPLDRFVALSTGGKGTVLSKPFTLVGNRLQINAVTNIGGHVQVELLDADGRAFDGYGLSVPFVGDALRHDVTFNGDGDLSALNGTTISLRFHLKDAKLYCFAFVK